MAFRPVVFIRSFGLARPFSSGVSPPSGIFESMSTFSTAGVEKYGGRFNVTLIPGDGIGKEMCSSVKTVFKALNVPIDFEEVEVSGYSNAPSQLKAAVESLKRTKIGLKGWLVGCV